MRTKDNVERQLHVLLERWRGNAAIIYCFSRQETEDVAAALSARGWRASPYHAGLAPEARRKAQEDFTRDRVPIIVATIAFGMGVDKPDVRLVVHTSLPKSVESYYQETGRAGRDGLPSECVLLYSYGDKVRQEFFVKRMDDEGERRNAQTKLDQTVRFAQLHTCRRRYLLEYFGERWELENCGATATSAWHRSCGGSSTRRRSRRRCCRRWCGPGERYGETHVIRVLVGSKDQRILAAGHDELSVYGIVGDYDRSQLREVLGLLQARGLLALNDGEYPTLRLTAMGRAFLASRERMSLPRLQAEEKAPGGAEGVGRRRRWSMTTGSFRSCARCVGGWRTRRTCRRSSSLATWRCGTWRRRGRRRWRRSGAYRAWDGRSWRRTGRRSSTR